MNNMRRKALADIQARVEGIKGELEALRDEEQEYIDNMPEGLADSERGTAAETAVGEMDTAVDALGDIDSNLNEASQ